MEWIRVSAKTVAEAITEAAIQLGTSSENMEYNVIEKGSTGFFGIGAKKAVIEARKKKSDEDLMKEVFGEKEEKPKKEYKKEPKKEAKDAAGSKETKAPVKTGETATAKEAPEEKKETTENRKEFREGRKEGQKEYREGRKERKEFKEGKKEFREGRKEYNKEKTYRAAKETDETQAETVQEGAPETGRSGRREHAKDGRRENRRDFQKGNYRNSRRNYEHDAAKETVKTADAEENMKVNAALEMSMESAAEETVKEEKAPKVPRVPADPEEAKKKAETFLTDLFRTMDMKVEMTLSFEDETLSIDISGEDMGLLIGKRGQTLDSLQYLTSLVVNKGNASYVRVKLDTEDYRNRRKATLENLAKNIAMKVKKTRRPVFLEPMNPYERRIIHSALQNDPYVTTHSEGDEPCRKVVVTLRKNNERHEKN